MGFLRVAEGEVALFLDPHAVPVSFKGPAPDSFCSKIQEGKGEQGPDSFRSISISPISSSDSVSYFQVLLPHAQLLYSGGK